MSTMTWKMRIATVVIAAIVMALPLGKPLGY